MSNKNYKRMAKNVAMLYFRMLLTMLVTLYTSRIILLTLGVEDYGIYNVVAGFVMMLGFLHGAMTSATQRFLSFEMGKSENRNPSGIFNMSMNIHIIIAIFVLLLGETIGVWFLRNKLTIPVDRIYAAEWVFHLSLVSFVITIISVPYNALIIAHEQMGVFAWVSIIDVTLKMLIVFMLTWFNMDKLVLYGLLSLSVALIIFFVYWVYCKRRYQEAKLRFYWDQHIFRTILSFTSWNLWGNLAAVMSNQGVNILLNIFFGPTVNAARAVAMQVSSALNKFVYSVQVAINPQIIKSYAHNNIEYMHNLICYGAKYNFFILLIISIPILNNTNIILETWLGMVPDDTSLFLQLVIYTILIDSISPPLMTAAQATGKIKLYQFVVGGILLLNVPIAYLVLKKGFDAYIVFYIAIFLSLTALIARLVIISKLINMKLNRYLKSTLKPILLVLLSTLFIDNLVGIHNAENIKNITLSTLVSTLIIVLSIILLGIDHIERNFLIKNYIKLKKLVIKNNA